MFPFLFHFYLFFFLQNHLERIIERPTGGRALPEQHKPLSRRESGSVTADDMRSLRGSGRSVFTTVFELREAGPEAVVTRPTVADLQVGRIERYYYCCCTYIK